MVRIRREHLMQTVKHGVLLGIAGGIAEIIWIAFYGLFTGGSAGAVARAVSATVSTALPGVSFEVAPVAYGIVIHLVLAVGLGIALVFAWRTLAGQRQVNEYAFMVAALATVWAFNFFVLLPLIDPAFVALMPYPASLLSKLLFGLAGAFMLRHMPLYLSASIPIHVRAP